MKRIFKVRRQSGSGSFREALKTYTVLTVGDGLVTMIPSLLVSMAGGIVVTRASSDATLSVDVGRQILSRRRPLLIAAGVMLALAAIPDQILFHIASAVVIAVAGEQRASVI